MHKLFPEPVYQVCDGGGGQTLAQYYYRQRPSRIDMVTRQILDWWRPPVETPSPTIDPIEVERQMLLSEIRRELLPPPA